MLFDPAKLPEKEWLKLSEVVNFLALGEALHAKAQVPADRIHLPEIEAALKRCRDQARDATRSAELPQLFWHSDFLELVGNDDSHAPFPPSSAQLERCKIAWPPYGQHLYDLVVAWERAHEQDNHRRAEAEQEVLQWLLSGEVEFEGMIVEDDRRGCRERIDVDHIFEPVIFWGHDRIAAHSRDGDSPRPGEPRQVLVWDKVQIKRSSLVRWLRPPPPDPAQLDPMQEEYWTLPMAVAWIRSRSADAVRDQWDAWLKECGERRLRGDGNFYREPRQRQSIRDLISVSPENARAWDALRRALANRLLLAAKLDAASQEYRSVPDSEWAIVEDTATIAPEDGLELKLHGVRLKSADVLRLWPSASGGAAAELSMTASQPRRGRGPPVQYVTDDSIVAQILYVLEREPDRPVAPLILETADALGCSPRTEVELDRLVDRVTRKVKRRRRRLSELRPG